MDGHEKMKILFALVLFSLLFGALWGIDLIFTIQINSPEIPITARQILTVTGITVDALTFYHLMLLLAGISALFLTYLALKPLKA